MLQLNKMQPRPSGAENQSATMSEFAQRFLRDTSGAVAVDFVVICALVVGLGVGVSMSVADGAGTLADKSETCLKRVSRQMVREDIDYTTQLTKMARRCGRL